MNGKQVELEIVITPRVVTDTDTGRYRAALDVTGIGNPSTLVSKEDFDTAVDATIWGLRNAESVLMQQRNEVDRILAVIAANNVAYTEIGDIEAQSNG